MNIFKKYIKNLNIKIAIVIFYHIIVLAITWYFTSVILLCDDGPDTKEWGQDWNKPVVTEDTPYNDQDGGNNNKYVPYRPGLQSTSQGYRYEADGKSVNYQLTKEGYRSEVDGRPVNYHPCSYDSTRRVNLNQMYSNNNNNAYNSDNVSYSTKIAVNPKGNSTIDSNSTIGGDTISSSEAKKFVKDMYKPLPEGQNIYIKRPNKARAIWDVIKDDFRTTRDEAYKSRQISNRNNERYMSNIKASRNAAAENRTQRYFEAINKRNSKYPVKVRRFD